MADVEAMDVDAGDGTSKEPSKESRNPTDVSKKGSTYELPWYDTFAESPTYHVPFRNPAISELLLCPNVYIVTFANIVGVLTLTLITILFLC